MFEEKFQNILQKDEKVVYSTKAFRKGYVLYKSFVNQILFSCIVIWTIPVYLLAIIPIMIIRAIGSKNYFVCLTNQRLIIRKGAFSNTYEQYDIENLGNVACKQTVFDRSNENACNLIVDKKSFHTDGKSDKIIIDSIENGYELSRLIDNIPKHNTTFNVKMEQ